MVTPPREVELVSLPFGGQAARFMAMASPCEVLVDGAEPKELLVTAQMAAREVWRIEQQWSRYRDDNIVHRINNANGAAVEVDPETGRFLDYAAHLHVWSDGLFDVTSGVLRRAWRFDGSDRIPTQSDIDALLPLVGWHRVRWNDRRLQMQPGMEIDFGGLGKEYAVDRACHVAQRVTSKPVLINCGGDLAASAPRLDGTPWQVGVDTGIPGDITPLIQLSQGAIATSGDAHRFLLKDGLRYSHVINPINGWALRNAPRAVTVAERSCTEAGVLATVALLHGIDAESFLRSAQCDFTITR